MGGGRLKGGRRPYAARDAVPEEGPSAWVGSPSTRVRPISPERPPPPSDPDACPPLDATYATALDRALATAGLGLDPGARAGIDAHARLLVAWNAAINLTAIRVPAAVALEHVADSLSALPLLRPAGAPGRAPPGRGARGARRGARDRRGAPRPLGRRHGEGRGGPGRARGAGLAARRGGWPARGLDARPGRRGA